MSYCILRTKKLKSAASVIASARHTFREQQTPNADEKRTPLNPIMGAKSSETLIMALRRRLPTKRRNDAVLAIEYLITASPEFFEERNGQSVHKKNNASYFNAALAFFKERHGAQNIISATVHLDETTPHLIMYVVPITADGRLAAKEFLGGPEKLRRLQTDFHSRVGAQFGLERGIEGSKARHQTVQKFYGQLRSPNQTKLRPADHIAAAFGIKSQAIVQSDCEKNAEVGRNASVSFSALQRMKRLRQQTASEAAELASELTQEKKKSERLITALTEVEAAFATNKRIATALHNENQRLQALLICPPSPTLKAQHAGKNSAPQLAPKTHHRV